MKPEGSCNCPSLPAMEFLREAEILGEAEILRPESQPTLCQLVGGITGYPFGAAKISLFLTIMLDAP